MPIDFRDMEDSALYLKRLDIYGFKSFGARTRLEFVPGITAVVGPNGSGKSNIADAVRWVLGEQSAKSLRGSKMEDVIFGGSDGKRPLGYAEVALTLDNSDGYIPLDYSEITITRRVYRSGESQYFINQTQCRLKDVQELFMDTGLGKDTYALIGQGQIDQVLNARPEDRRNMIEEAAGIVKYRTRRTETQRKLEDTQQYLLRVNDIIAEIERQLLPLEKEAEKAEQYQRLAEELKQVELSVYAAELKDLDASKAAIEESFAAVQADLVSVSEENAKLEADMMRQKDLVGQTEVELERKSEAVGELSQKLTTIKHERSLALTQSANLQERKEESIREVARCREQISLHNAFMREAQGELSELERQIAELEAEKTRIERETGQFAVVLKEREAALAALEDEENEIAQQIAKIEQNLVAWNERRGSFLTQRGVLLERLDRCKAERAAAEKTVLELAANYGAMTERLAALEHDIDRTSGKLAVCQSARKELNSQTQKLASRQQSLRSRLKILKEMETEYEGYSRAVKSVMQAARQGKLAGIVGTVAELLRVPNEFVTAIETAIGSSLQSIVTETREQAEKAIQFLKTVGVGRATFLPLDGLWSTPLSPSERKRLQEIPGYVGVADELVEYLPAHQTVVQYLLGRVIVTSDMKAAIAVSQATRRFSRIVTTDGDQISPGGAMTGGSAPKSNSAGLLTRRQEIDELAKEAQGLEKELTALEEQMTAVDAEIGRLQEKASSLQAEKHGLDVELAAVARDLANAREAKDRAALQEKHQQDEVSRVDEELASLQERICTAEKELDEIAERRQGFASRMAGIAAEIESLKKEHSEADQVITACLVELAGLKEKKQAVLDKLKDSDRRLAELSESERQREAEADELQSRIDAAEKQVAEYDHVLSVLEKDLAMARTEEQKLREVVKSYRHRLESLLEQIESGRNSAGLLQMKLHEAQRRLDRVNLQIAHLAEKLAIDYELTQEQLEETVVPAADLAASRRRVNVLRDEVKRIGTVNLNAADEYAALRDRYDFLTQQREDLVNARHSLQKVIDEMDQVSQERFMSTFERVRKNFQTVFEQLFGGGTCDLILSEGDPSAQGLEIMAQPPGKKLQTLSLLSGGERALAALSFLFALLEEHPSPFCVLDEVDAALDEANLTRFAQLLRTYSGSTQFLVITHRQGTMELADVLYGVTMGGDGISKLVSVKLSDETAQQPVEVGDVSR